MSRIFHPKGNQQLHYIQCKNSVQITSCMEEINHFWLWPQMYPHLSWQKFLLLILRQFITDTPWSIIQIKFNNIYVPRESADMQCGLIMHQNRGTKIILSNLVIGWMLCGDLKSTKKGDIFRRITLKGFSSFLISFEVAYTYRNKIGKSLTNGSKVIALQILKFWRFGGRYH